MIGLLTETIGNPTPMEIPFVPQRQLPSGDLPFPITPQTWHFRQSIDYSITANRAVIDVASRYRETLLFNIYRMGRNSIDRGSADTWTASPSRLDAVRAAIVKDQPRDEGPGFNPSTVPGGFASAAPAKYFDRLRDPATRDPRGYIIPSDQDDFLTATKFVNALLKSGVTGHRATQAFQVGGRSYPVGSYVIKTAQAFRPHILDMFEPQDHPNDFQYPGGPPIPPYDNAGYTLAFQMGVKFDRVLEAFDGPFERIPDLVAPAPGRVGEATGAAGYLLSPRVNDAFIAVNRLLKNNEEVYRVPSDTKVGAASLGPGAFFIPATASTPAAVKTLAQTLGVEFHAAATRPTGDLIRLRPVRVGLWDRYGGSMPSGWIRWLLEQFDFPFEVVYPPTLDAGNLASRFDVLIFPADAIPQRDGERRGFFFDQAARGGHGARGVARAARRHHRREDRAATEGVCRGWRHADRDREFHQRDPALRTADRERAGRTHGHGRAGPASRQVLHPGLGDAGCRPAHASPRLGDGPGGRRVLRREPGVHDVAAGPIRRGEGRGLVPGGRHASQRVGLGSALPEWCRGRGRSPTRARQGAAVRS